MDLMWVDENKALILLLENYFKAYKKDAYFISDLEEMEFRIRDLKPLKLVLSFKAAEFYLQNRLGEEFNSQIKLISCGSNNIQTLDLPWFSHISKPLEIESLKSIFIDNDDN